MRTDRPHSSDETFLDDLRQASQPTSGAEGRAEVETVTHVAEKPPASGSVVRLPERIGRYAIVRKLGAGGMGVVYEAVQDRPKRTVALKAIKPSLVSASALKRFEYESNVLANLRHPGIAQVYEAGTYVPDPSRDREGADAVPYFAMELIPSPRPITGYAKEKKFDTRQRLEMFVKVCEAVYHGHQKGVIHRDLKPGNILVDPEGQPKIIDFGVARSTDSDLAVTTMRTGVGQLIGTLPYMSPEQCKADPHDIDTRSDVYALGVVLYELLCGRLPYDVSRLSIFDAVRVVREQAPTKLSTVNRTLRGDLETIVFKALEKERERRYQSASELAQDIRRYLKNEPILARPPSRIYRMKKFARRHSALVAGTAVVFIILVAATAVSTAQAVRATRAEREQSRERQRAEQALAEAEAARAEAEAVTEFLSDTLAAASPMEMGKDVSVREVLDRAAEQIGERFSDQPLLEAKLRYTLGSTYYGLGYFNAAERHFLHSATTLRKTLGEHHPRTLHTAAAHAHALMRTGALTESEALLESALAIAQRAHGEQSTEAQTLIGNLAIVAFQRGRIGRAEELFRKSLEYWRRLDGGEAPRTLTTMNNLGGVLLREGKLAEGEQLLRETYEARARLLSQHHPHTLDTMMNLATALQHQGKFAAAEKLQRANLAIRGSVLGDSHLRTLVDKDNLGNNLRAQGRLAEAKVLKVEALEELRRSVGGNHSDTLRCAMTLGSLLLEGGEYQEAEALLMRTMHNLEQTLGANHPYTLDALSHLAQLARKQGKHEDAYQHIIAMLDLYKERANDAWASSSDLQVYAQLLLTVEPLELQQPRKALPAAHKAVELTGRQNAGMLATLALAYQQTGQHAEAVETQREALALLSDEWSPLRADMESSLGEYLVAYATNESPDDNPQIARQAVQCFAEAEPLLVGSYEWMNENWQGAGDRLHGFIERLVTLYESWDAAEPGKGYAEKAAQWRMKLGEVANEATRQHGIQRDGQATDGSEHPAEPGTEPPSSFPEGGTERSPG